MDPAEATLASGVALSSGAILSALLLCGLMGLVGQGIRAAIGMKGNKPPGEQPGELQAFSAAYMMLSLMIGFIAGVIAGIGIGLQNFITINPLDIKLLLAVAASGYAGADFIEGSLSIVIPAKGATGAAPLPGQTDPRLMNFGGTDGFPPRPNGGSVTPAVPTGPSRLATAIGIVAPSINTAVWVPALSAAFAKFDLTNNRRVAAAMGQFLVEAGAGFSELAENLNYTTAKRASDIFSTAFPTPQDAEPYLRKPEALGNRVYANRLGNGDEASGDGYRFRGRGLIQLTGRDEYTEFGLTIGKSPEEVSAYCETPEGAAMSGCWYLASRGCLPLADAWQIDTITRKVNGAAMVGKEERLRYAEAMLKHLGG